MTLKRAATEKRSLETVLGARSYYVSQAGTVLQRLARIGKVYPGATVVDVGAAQGMFVLACAELGFQTIGVEPFAPAREVANQVAQTEGRQIRMVEGAAEAIPLADASVDVVHARSVIEHVVDAQRSFDEAFRVLRPGGVFWFGTASSMCPRQDEISGFPLFGWYPDPLKRRVMQWCKTHRPELIGHGVPALHWFTPWKARRMLRKAGFSRVYDRWDLRLPSEGGRSYQLALHAIRHVPGARIIADVIVAGCSYAAVK